MKLPIEIGKLPCKTDADELARYEAIVRDCAKVCTAIANGMYLPEEQAGARICESNILTRYSIKTKDDSHE